MGHYGSLRNTPGVGQGAAAVVTHYDLWTCHPAHPSSRFRSAVTEIVGRLPTSLITCGKSGWPPVFRDKKGAICEAFHFLERAYGSARVSGVSGDQRRRA